MTWTLTHTGKVFDLLNPMPEQVELKDLSRHLSRIARFSGATAEPYSVAQHSVLVSAIATRFSNSPLTGMYGLLHDCHEAYIGDFPSPVKYALKMHCPEFGNVMDILTNSIDAAIYEHFGLPPITEIDRKFVKRADIIALATERKHLMPEGGPDWQLSEKPWAELKTLPCHPAEEAEVLFLETFKTMKVTIETLATQARGAA